MRAIALAARLPRLSLGGVRARTRAVATAAATPPTAAPPSAEARMAALLRERLDAVEVVVKDVSGGCGAFYDVLVVSPRFVGTTIVAQHRLVCSVLELELGKMHGLTVKTATPATRAAAVAAAAAPPR